jgi:hypothetical protein
LRRKKDREEVKAAAKRRSEKRGNKFGVEALSGNVY